MWEFLSSSTTAEAGEDAQGQRTRRRVARHLWREKQGFRTAVPSTMCQVLLASLRHLTSPPLLADQEAQARRQRTRTGKERPAATHLYDHILLSRPQVLSHTSPSDLARPPGGTLAGGAWGNAVSQRAHRKEAGSLVGQGGFGWVAR